MECLNAQIFNKNYRTEFAYYQVRVAWVVYEGFLTQKKSIAKFCELMLRLCFLLL